MGLADHTIVAEVAEPVADCVAPVLVVDDEELLLQPATPRAPTIPTMAVSCQPFRWRLPGYLRDPILPPL